MGTNYYARIDECECCGRFDELHLGKSSMGWCFTLHVYPEEGVNTLDDLLKLIPDEEATIYDEYGAKVSLNEFVDVVVARSRSESITERDFSKDPFNTSVEDFLYRNHAELGPNNLLRHKIDRFCIGHGEGTWDYCVGDFS